MFFFLFIAITVGQKVKKVQAKKDLVKIIESISRNFLLLNFFFLETFLKKPNNILKLIYLISRVFVLVCTFFNFLAHCCVFAFKIGTSSILNFHDFFLLLSATTTAAATKSSSKFSSATTAQRQ